MMSSITTISQTKIPVTRISFPGISLRTRDGHRLRGYFGDLFREHSPILHNHYEDGSLRYGYPLVQYKILHGKPTLVGLWEGAELLAKLFTKIHELNLAGEKIAVMNKNIHYEQALTGLSEDLYQYKFENLWMALNLENHRDYMKFSAAERKAQLKRVLISQILVFFKDIGLWLKPEERIVAHVKVTEREAQFKNQTMLAFSGTFTANVLLPEGLGLGKQVARGFGAIKRI